MKKKLVKMALICSVIFMASCQKSHDSIINNNQPVAPGPWHVSLFTDSGNDETAGFSGYAFTFSDGGSLVAAKGVDTTTGTWSRSSKFNIGLGPKGDANIPLGELTDDWHILSITDNEIKLGDDNVASGELLTFTKN